MLAYYAQFLINLLFAAALVSSGSYILSLYTTRGPAWQDEFRRIGRTFLVAVCVGTLCASGLQLYNILTHDFRYTYVWGHSSRELSIPLLLATFYAGQEGSFMLWTVLVSVLGVSLLPYVRKHRYESEVMAFYALILVFLLLMLVAKSPFALVWESFAQDGIPEGFMPRNGKGLNPLLQNLWITIHPPILFAGFASMSVPFAFAMAALLKREYHQWIRISLPWVLFGTAVLGFGIMLGGFWAYETLGWGGFWGWDPVENSSLIPWLVAVALVHTMLVQQKTGGLVRTNFTLAILAFIMVLYSTFLTRSGILGDTSVHSFVDPGLFAYVLLLACIAVFAAIGFGIFALRMKDIRSPKANFHYTSREFGLSIGAALTLSSAVIVTIGTSWPIVCEILKQPKVAIDIAYYNTMHLPLAIVIACVNGASIVLRWRFTTLQQFRRGIVVPVLFAGIASMLLALIGVRDPAYLALVFGALFALCTNVDMALRFLRLQPQHSGAFLSHAGIALLLLGIVAASRYSLTKHVALPQGVPKQVLGYTVLFVGREQVEQEYKDREKYKYYIALEKDGKQHVVAPVLYWSDFNKRQSAFLEPGIQRTLAGDMYIAPKALETEGDAPTAIINKQHPVVMPLDSTYTLLLKRFDMSQAMAAMQGGTSPNDLRLGVVIELVHHTPHGADTTVQTLYTTFKGREGIEGNAAAQHQEPYNIPGTTYFIAFQRILANKDTLAKSQALLAFADSSKPQTVPRQVFVVELSYKPFINLVWGGVLLMVIGLFVAMVRRRKELKIAPDSVSHDQNTTALDTAIAAVNNEQ
ncbi:MAG: cytochrome c-type biogenesis CcmF C-terminal domain-containing protein [Bacteroidota bacterium]|nr:cytochrome c biogenesis protein CcsA [Candidatus Kapabacteria bacterium]MDW8219664.1 cytochrome c-type biogenesis CcmF C-terminal domain-containing protein [Bacteroidota bacterium]